MMAVLLSSVNHIRNDKVQGIIVVEDAELISAAASVEAYKVT